MNNNKLKIIACISMLVDHIGMMLFPSIGIFRMIGRLAMPIFAFFIAEGCRYTRNKLRYFLQVFVLGIVCQAVYIANDLINGTFNSVYCNILITFSLSILLCYMYLEIEKAYLNKQSKTVKKYVALLTISIFLIYFVLIGADNVIGMEFSVDYGLRGIILPLCACIFTDKNKKIAAFSAGLIIPMMLVLKDASTIICTSLSIPLIYAYDGTYGSKKLKYLFYIFYPTHLVILHLIKICL